MVTPMWTAIGMCAWAFGTLNKLTVLPNVKMNRGPEHDGEAKDWDSWTPYETTRGSDSKDQTLTLTGAELNPTSLNIKAGDKEMMGTDQSLIMPNSEKELIHSEGGEPKDVKNDEESTTGSPKSSDRHGDGEPVLSHGRTQPTTQGVKRNQTAGLRAGEASLGKVGTEINAAMTSLRLKSKDHELYSKMLNEEIFLAAYHKIKSKPGNMTPGSDNETLDGISIKRIKEDIRSLTDQSFQFRPVRRTFIPKANGKMRPLGIPCPMDKLEQEVMRMLLEQIYEPVFSDYSHGFRPGRGCHSALKQISQWNGVTWVIEGDIKGYFDNVNHAKLAELMEKRISDTRFMNLYWKLVRAGYVESGEQKDSRQGVPQGGVLSPLLSNIYLNEFDEFMSSKIDEITTKERLISKVNPKIPWYSVRLTRLSEEYKETRDPQILKELKALRKERNSLPTRIRNGTRIYYVRYADDWVVGVLGNRATADKLKTEIGEYLRTELHLELSQEKTKITNLGNDRAKFLGVEFHIPSPKESKVVTRQMSDGRRVAARVNHTRVYLNAPMKEIFLDLRKAGFTKNDKGAPGAISKWVFLEHRAILLRYNAVARGYANYYSFVDNYRAIVSMIEYTLLHSCAKTLARKFGLGSRYAVFRRFGKGLTPRDDITEMEKQTAQRNNKHKPIEFFLPSTGKKVRQFKTGTGPTPDPLKVMNWRLETQIALFQSCLICGTEEDIQMHHVKHIRRGTEKPTGFQSIMAKLNRKQIPVCPTCHNNIHAGRYDGASLGELQKSNAQRLQGRVLKGKA